MIIRVRQENEAVTVAQRGEIPRDWPRCFQMDDHENPTVRSIVNQQPVVVANRQEGEAFLRLVKAYRPKTDEDPFPGLNSYAVFPFQHGKQLVGFIEHGLHRLIDVRLHLGTVRL